MRDDFGNLLAYDDESAPCGNGAAAITWTATYSGLVKVQMNEFDCTTNSICGDLAVTWLTGAVILGCTDATALNYNPDATVDDGSCLFLEGCTNEFANNYNPDAVIDDGSCTFDLICDCAGTSHTAGVLIWIGDSYADSAAYEWEGQLVDFNCATWGYDCGDIDSLLTEDPFSVCLGNLPPNNGCGAIDVFGCMDPLANNYNPDANIDDMSCQYGSCGTFMITAVQQPCVQDNAGVLFPVMDFTYTLDGGCEIDSIVFVNDMGEFPVATTAANNVSGSTVSYLMDANSIIGMYIILADGTASPTFEFNVGDCSQDALICDCDGNAHTIGVLEWIGDTFADSAAYTWAGQTVNFNCATWGYDCGDIAGAPAQDPNGVCDGNLPPNNGCASDVVFGCTDTTANNYDETATTDDGSCTYDVFGCMDPLANNYNPDANVDDQSCTYGSCDSLVLTAVQTPCIPDQDGVFAPGMNFTFELNGGCTIDSLVIILDGAVAAFNLTAPDNVSGSSFALDGFPTDVTISAYFVLSDGTVSSTYDFVVGNCDDDALICDCAGNAHSIGVLTWLGDTYADDGSYIWVDFPVDFNCATWGYDCGDIAGAPAEDPHGVCDGNLPPNNGCAADDVFGCTDPTANNYNPDATVNDGSCTYDVLGCTDPTANNYNPDANVDDGSCTYGTCDNFELTAVQTPCFQDNAGNLNPGMDFTFTFDGGCTVDSLVITLDGVVFPLVVDAPDNVSGSLFPVAGFPVNSAITVYYVLTDGTVSPTFEFTIGDCSQDPTICDCDGNEHTIGVLSWIGDTFADDGAYTWGGVTVNFNCATWGYDCGDIAGAPAEDPYGVCAGNLPPQNGCGLNVSEIGTSTLMEAYPNPTSGLLTVVSRGVSELKQIRVFDQSGKLLMNEQRLMVNGIAQQLDLTSLAAGSYHIQIVGLSHVSNVSVIVQK